MHTQEEDIYNASFRGQLNLVKCLLASSDISFWNTALIAACRGGQLDIVEFLILSDYLIHYGNGFREICFIGNLSIAKILVCKISNDWNYWLYYACQGGHIDIVNLVIELGANNWNQGLVGACSTANLEIVKLMIRLGGSDLSWNHAFSVACYTSQLNNYKRKDLVEIMIILLSMGHKNILYLRQNRISSLELCEGGLDLKVLKQFDLQFYNAVLHFRSCIVLPIANDLQHLIKSYSLI